MSEFEAFEDWADPLPQRLEPAAWTKLAKMIAQQLRHSQQQRIAA